jgi:hypothetical protein
MNFTSPQDGIVTQVLYDGKEAAFPAQSLSSSPIVTISSQGRYQAVVEVPQSIDRKLQLGSTAVITLPDGSSGNGSLTFSGVVPKNAGNKSEDPNKRAGPAQYLATVSFEYKLGSLPAGILAQVQLKSQADHTAKVCIPWNAVSSSDGADWVQKLIEGDDWKRTKVKLGRRDNELVEVLEGVSAHEPVKSRLW